LHRDYVYFKHGQLNLLNDETRLFKNFNNLEVETPPPTPKNSTNNLSANISADLSNQSGSLNKPLNRKKVEQNVDNDGFPIRKIHIKMRKAKGLKFREDD
jgi:hypothetical protein